MKVPERLARRPMFKGFPVPANVLVDASGIPDFATVNEAEAFRLLKERRCALCGEPLNRWFALIGGPGCAASHFFRDGPIHVECAKYSLVVCPFLAKPDHAYRQVDREHEGYATVDVNIVSAEKPEQQGLFIARDYVIGRLMGHIIVKVGPYREVSWWRGGVKVEQDESAS